MSYKLKTEINGMRHRTYYEEEPQKVNIKKGKLRDNISKISDRDDLIADLFKLNFLTISALKYVYYALPDDIKDNIPEDAKTLLDNSFKKYENTKTVMDLYLENGDTTFIDRVLERQEEITKVIENR